MVESKGIRSKLKNTLYHSVIVLASRSNYKSNGKGIWDAKIRSTRWAKWWKLLEWREKEGMLSKMVWARAQKTNDKCRQRWFQYFLKRCKSLLCSLLLLPATLTSLVRILLPTSHYINYHFQKSICSKDRQLLRKTEVLYIHGTRKGRNSRSKRL